MERYYNRTRPKERHGHRMYVNPCLRTLGGFLDGNSLFFTHGGDDSNQKILSFLEISLNLLSKVTLRDLDIIFRGSILGHEIEEALVNVNELVFVTRHVRDVHIVSRGTDIFQFFTSEDIDSNKMDFSVTVLAGLRSRHFDDLARTAFYNDMSVFTESRALHGEGGGRASTCLLKGLVVGFIVGHDGQDNKGKGRKSRE